MERNNLKKITGSRWFLPVVCAVSFVFGWWYLSITTCAPLGGDDEIINLQNYYYITHTPWWQVVLTHAKEILNQLALQTPRFRPFSSPPVRSLNSWFLGDLVVYRLYILAWTYADIALTAWLAAKATHSKKLGALAFCLLPMMFSLWQDATGNSMYSYGALAQSTLLPVLLAGYGSIGMVVVTVTISVFVDVLRLIYCFGKLHIWVSFRNFDGAVLKDIAVFSGFIAINMVVDQVNNNLDKLIITRYCGTAATAVYAVGQQLHTYFISFSTAVSSVFTPRIHQLVQDNKDDKARLRTVLTELFVRVGRIQFLILSLVCTGIIFFGKPFIYFWAGPGYDDAYIIVLLLIHTLRQHARQRRTNAQLSAVNAQLSERNEQFRQLNDCLRAANKIKYLAGSESGMAAWVSDTTPELIAKRFHELGPIDIEG